MEADYSMEECMSKTNAGYALTVDDVSAYQEHGTLCLRGVFEEDQIDALRDAVEIALANPGPYAKEFNDPGGARFLGDVFVSARHPVIREILLESALGEIAGKLMKSDTIRFFFDHLLVKEPGAAQPTPWHQDAPYFPMKGFDCCGIWIALDHVNSENGAVEYLRGTHKSGTLYAPRSFAEGHAYDDQLTEVPDIDAHRADYDVASWDLEPGDCTVHHVRALHGAPGNTTAGARRRGIATRWIGDDAVFELRPGIPDDMLNTLADLASELKPGQPFDHSLFPIVWENQEK